MCLACEEMDLYFAYLEQKEAADRVASKASGETEAYGEQSGVARFEGPAQEVFVCDESTSR
jgi:hypothetical protein